MDEKATPKPEAKAKAVEAEVTPEPKPEPIVIKAEPAAPLLEAKDSKGETLLKVEAPAPEPAKVEEPEPEPVKAEAPTPPIEPPSAPALAKLFSVKTDAYIAWVTQHGDSAFLANLELTGGSVYNWPADSAKEAEALLKYHIANQKL